MAITEATRHRLYQALEQAIGQEEATTLMEHLPPVGWDDVATRRDIDHLRGEMELRFEALEHRLLSAMHQETKTVYRTVVAAIVGCNAVLAGVALALA
ncbi:MAG TPA: hypothetical protein VGB14_14840 [Acidimicrobiales bacterium]|jgi:hypothetical protein